MPSIQLLTSLETCLDAPLETDPAFLDAQTRRQICEDLYHSKFFVYSHIEAKKSDLSIPMFSHIFQQIYTINSENYAEYSNPYRLLEFKFDESDSFKEWVFLCPLKDWHLWGMHFGNISYIHSYYVSKEYHVAPYNKPYKPGRFIIGSRLPLLQDPKYNVMILAEEPARANLETDFSVELHYLRLRKHIRPGMTLIVLEAVSMRNLCLNFLFVLSGKR